MTMTMPLESGAATPTIKAGIAQMELRQDLKRALVRTVVDTSLHRPDMFELTFMDPGGDVLAMSGLDIGAKVSVEVADSLSNSTLISGEITSIEGDYDNLMMYTVVRGYEHAHRLQKQRRSRTFIDSSDGDIARRVAGDAGLAIGTIEDPGVTHRYMAQVAQTDWEFLKGRADELGYDVGVTEGKFFFKPAPGMSAGGPLGAAAGAATSLVGGGNTLRFGHNLLWFRPRLASSGLVEEAEVRVWDPETVGVITSLAGLSSKTADLSEDAAGLADAQDRKSVV